MMTITIMHTKGGVGKTTSSMYLATAATRENIPTVVVDADPQGSATAWAKIATRNDRALPFDVIAPSRRIDASVKNAAGPSGLVLIDTPPGTPKIIADALEVADVVIVPCGASPIELQRVWPTLDTLKGYPAVVLLTNVDMRSTLVEKVRARLLEEQVPVMRSLVPQRSAIKKTFGRPPVALHGYDDVLKELIGALV